MKELYEVVPDMGRSNKGGMSHTCVIIRLDLTYRVRKDLTRYKIPEVWVTKGSKKKKNPS